MGKLKDLIVKKFRDVAVVTWLISGFLVFYSFYYVPGGIYSNTWNDTRSAMILTSIIGSFVAVVFLVLYYRFWFDVSSWTPWRMWWIVKILLTIVCIFITWQTANRTLKSANGPIQWTFVVTVCLAHAFVTVFSVFQLFSLFLNTKYTPLIRRGLPPVCWFYRLTGRQS